MKGFSAQKLWTHLSLRTEERTTNRESRRSAANEVRSFPELVEGVAKLSVQNSELALFFRGQDKDFKLKSGASSSYPGIFRSPGDSLSDDDLRLRFEQLDHATKKLTHALRKKRIDGHDKLAKFPELVWAILQHYEVCATPLLDITHSLRVAASFALNNSREGYVLVYGFPHPSGSITYSVEQELMNIRLLSICPPEAKRPYFQEGFLVGTFPARAKRKHPSHDVCTRLLAKFHLKNGGFWDNDFQPIPEPALFPKADEVKEICDEIVADI